MKHGKHGSQKSKKKRSKDKRSKKYWGRKRRKLAVNAPRLYEIKCPVCRTGRRNRGVTLRSL